MAKMFLKCYTFSFLMGGFLYNTFVCSAERLFTEQHRQILLHQHQLQQIFNSQQVTPVSGAPTHSPAHIYRI